VAEPASETGPIVRTVEIAAPAADVFALLTEPDALVRWWPDAAEVEPRVGGRVRMEFAGGASVVTGEVTRYEPPSALGLTWIRAETPDVVTTIEFTITPLDAGRSRVEVIHAGWEQAPRLRPMHDAGWSHFLRSLAALGEGRPFERAFTPRPEEGP
jgi:uncharacterized protein YndB with AHSA1/START domain